MRGRPLQEFEQPFLSRPAHPRPARVLWLEIHGFSWLPFLTIEYEGLTEAGEPQPKIVYCSKHNMARKAFRSNSEQFLAGNALYSKNFSCALNPSFTQMGKLKYC
jgi:hypothetical protein